MGVFVSCFYKIMGLCNGYQCWGAFFFFRMVSHLLRLNVLQGHTNLKVVTNIFVAHPH